MAHIVEGCASSACELYVRRHLGCLVICRAGSTVCDCYTDEPCVVQSDWVLLYVIVTLRGTVCVSVHRDVLYAGRLHWDALYVSQFTEAAVCWSLHSHRQSVRFVSGYLFVLHAFGLTNPNRNPNIFLLILIITLTTFSPNPNHNPDDFLLVLFVTLTSLSLLGFIKLRRLSWP